MGGRIVDAVALRSLKDRQDVFYPMHFVMTHLKPIGHHVRNTFWVPCAESESNLSDRRLNRILAQVAYRRGTGSAMDAVRDEQPQAHRAPKVFGMLSSLKRIRAGIG